MNLRYNKENPMDNPLVSLAVDTYRASVGGNTNFSGTSADEMQDTLRFKLNELAGNEDGKFSWKKWQKNKREVFEILETVLDILISEGLTTQFDDLVEYKQVEIGERVAFRIQDYRLFHVAMVAAGNRDLRRQRIDHEILYIDTDWYGVSIYDEFDRFLSGQTDFGVLVKKLNASFTAKIAEQIYEGITTGYNALSAPYKVTGSYDRTSMINLVQHIKAATGQAVTVYGTLGALQKAMPYAMSYNGNAIEQRNALGFFPIIDGVQYQEIQQAHKPGTDTFAINDNFLLALPNGEDRIVKFVNEGETRIVDDTSQRYQNMDGSLEYSVRKKYGLGIVTSTRWGVYILS